MRKNGHQSVIAALHRSPLPEDLSPMVISEFGFDIQSPEAIRRVLDKHKDDIYAVWNLAAPLSVDTAKDPSAAERITVGGMGHLLATMKDLGLNRIFFSDSIGSFGRSSPRDAVSANWLVHNPEQNPGSDYGVQKRRCRELMDEYARTHMFDARFVIIPGVLHSDSSWSGGTTEYALDALWAAHRGEPYVCPVPADTRLPMIHIDDLTAGMVKLSQADSDSLTEPQKGYSLAGFSFSPAELFAEIQKHVPSFSYLYDASANPHVADFAETWPDSLSPEEAARDFDFRSSISMAETVANVLQAHTERGTK